MLFFFYLSANIIFTCTLFIYIVIAHMYSVFGLKCRRHNLQTDDTVVDITLFDLVCVRLIICVVLFIYIIVSYQY